MTVTHFCFLLKSRHVNFPYQHMHIYLIFIAMHYGYIILITIYRVAPLCVFLTQNYFEKHMCCKYFSSEEYHRIFSSLQKKNDR